MCICIDLVSLLLFPFLIADENVYKALVVQIEMLEKLMQKYKARLLFTSIIPTILLHLLYYVRSIVFLSYYRYCGVSDLLNALVCQRDILSDPF